MFHNFYFFLKECFIIFERVVFLENDKLIFMIIIFLVLNSQKTFQNPHLKQFFSSPIQESFLL